MSKKFDGRTCPACGSRTLFIGSGGYVTCSWIECPQPDTSAAIEQLLAAASEEAARAARIDELEKLYRKKINASTYIQEDGTPWGSSHEFEAVRCTDVRRAIAAITPPAQGLAEEEGKS